MIIKVNGQEMQFQDGMNALDIAAALGDEVRKSALAARVNGTVQDLAMPISGDAEVEFLTGKDADGLRVLRHTASHVLAQAVKNLRPPSTAASTTISTWTSPSRRSSWPRSKRK